MIVLFYVLLYITIYIFYTAHKTSMHAWVSVHVYWCSGGWESQFRMHYISSYWSYKVTVCSSEQICIWCTEHVSQNTVYPTTQWTNKPFHNIQNSINQLNLCHSSLEFDLVFLSIFRVSMHIYHCLNWYL